MPNNANTSLSYKDAGVDIDAGNELVDSIKTIASKTHRPEVMGSLGGFAALFNLDTSKYENPVLVSATDGVGTKLKLALELAKHDTIGIDLVAMCVNDLIVCGAEPLFFLDYFATGHLETDIAKQVITGIGQGCEQSGSALIGGETAEMPGMYQSDDYDLAGFSVGVVEKSKIIDGEKVKPGDVLLGLASSGPHSNGYSLIRKLLNVTNTPLETPFEDETFGETLLRPTRIYVKSILNLIKQTPVHALAHITGGGLIENLPRVLPAHCQAIIEKKSWSVPPIFSWLQTQANIKDEDMFKTFNMGIGMVVCVPESDADKAIAALQQTGETVSLLGHIAKSNDEKPSVVLT